VDIVLLCYAANIDAQLLCEENEENAQQLLDYNISVIGAALGRTRRVAKAISF